MAGQNNGKQGGQQQDTTIHSPVNEMVTSSDNMINDIPNGVYA